MISLYPPVIYSISPPSAYHQMFEQATVSVNAPVLTGYPNANDSSVPGSTYYTGWAYPLAIVLVLSMY
jgi:hypothetical protein